MISIHALLAESDEFESIVRCYVAIFLSTLSLRRATGHRLCHAVFSPISIHALLAESDDVYDHKLGTLCISIHALLAESDSCKSLAYMGIIGFLSTLSLRRATLVCEWHTRPESFLSTLSLRRATSWRFPLMTLQTNFYPRSPCGERLLLCHFLRFDRHISIHALLAESDPRQYARRNAHMYFYPRSPCGERLHAPSHSLYLRNNFYPRSPCGERRVTVLGIQHRTGISINALLAESDLKTP